MSFMHFKLGRVNRAKTILMVIVLQWQGSGLNPVRCTFGEATSLAAFFAGQPLDGILGLAYVSIAVDHVTPVFYEMMKQLSLDYPVFTFWLQELS